MQAAEEKFCFNSNSCKAGGLGEMSASELGLPALCPKAAPRHVHFQMLAEAS